MRPFKPVPCVMEYWRFQASVEHTVLRSLKPLPLLHICEVQIVAMMRFLPEDTTDADCRTVEQAGIELRQRNMPGVPAAVEHRVQRDLMCGACFLHRSSDTYMCPPTDAPGFVPGLLGGLSCVKNPKLPEF